MREGAYFNYCQPAITLIIPNPGFPFMLSDRKLREETFIAELEKLRGSVLEVGFGKGKTLGDYAMADEVVAVERDAGRVEYGNRLVQAQEISGVKCMQAEGEALPFQDDRFDAVCCSLLICSVWNQEKAVSEFFRVLKPGGLLIAYENTLSDRPLLRTTQQILSPLLRPLSKNCRMNNQPLKLIESAGFEVQETKTFRFWLEPRMLIKAVRPDI